MERALQGNYAREQAHSERWNRGSRDPLSPFQLDDESPSLAEWRLHNNEKNPNQNHPPCVKEMWSFGPVVYSRCYRYDGSEASLHRILGSWSGDSVNNAARRFHGPVQVGCAYSIRFRGVSSTTSGGTRTLQHISQMAIRAKQQLLQLAPSEDESSVSRGCPEGTEAFETQSE